MEGKKIGQIKGRIFTKKGTGGRSDGRADVNQYTPTFSKRGYKNEGADRKCKNDRTFFSSCLNKNYINELLNNCTFRNEHGK